MNKLKTSILPIVAFITALLLFGSCDDVNCLPDSHFTEDGELKEEFLPDSSIENELPSNVKFFLEVSGSMNGLYRAQCSTEFRDDVYQIVCYYTPQTEKVYTLCTNNGKSGFALSLNDFAKAIKQQGFPAMSTTSITDMIESVIAQIDTAQNEVGVLVSDMKFDPTGKDNINFQLGMYTTKISHITSSTGLAFSLICATSKYYDKKGNVICNESPYYYLVIGKSANVAKVRDGISTMLAQNGNYVDNIETGMRFGGPNYTLNREDNCLPHANDKYAFVDYDNDDPCRISISLELNKYRWCIAEPENVKKALEIKMLHGGTLNIDSIKIDSVFVDSKKELSRSMKARIYLKIDNMPNDMDVVEWSFDPCKLDTDYDELKPFCGAQNWTEFDKTFSLEHFIKGMFRGANLSTCSSKKNYILISQHY